MGIRRVYGIRNSSNLKDKILMELYKSGYSSLYEFLENQNKYTVKYYSNYCIVSQNGVVCRF